MRGYFLSSIIILLAACTLLQTVFPFKNDGIEPVIPMVLLWDSAVLVLALIFRKRGIYSG
jgi:hypothetical protein